MKITYWHCTIYRMTWETKIKKIHWSNKLKNKKSLTALEASYCSKWGWNSPTNAVSTQVSVMQKYNKHKEYENEQAQC